MSLYGFQLSVKFLSQVYIFDCQESLKLTSCGYVLCFELDFYSYLLVRLTLNNYFMSKLRRGLYVSGLYCVYVSLRFQEPSW